ncbi:hypothetical protein [Pseudomonas sp. G5(2012)]|uniref:hypothetical protein n=1 Tax=Pseudomonas sp. G5(2012) TaxID=1268068 RepID=UPI0005B4D10D|nr:hypothetical protein [Pseudomonas sp. G5(2012)]
MSTDKTPRGTKSSGHFEWTIKGVNFHTEQIYIWHEGPNIQINGYFDFAGPNQKIMTVLIDRDTPGEEQTFDPPTWLKEVSYQADSGSAYAITGKYTATLNKHTKQYKLSFDLLFGGGLSIQCKLDVSE